MEENSKFIAIRRDGIKSLRRKDHCGSRNVPGPRISGLAAAQTPDPRCRVTNGKEDMSALMDVNPIKGQQG